MTTRVRIAALLFLLAAACASAGGAAGGGKNSSRFMQADQKFPNPNNISEDAFRTKLEEAMPHVSRARQAQESGNMDQARAEYNAAGDVYTSALDIYPNNDWRMPIALRAAQLFMAAAQPEKAGNMAQRIVADPEANETSKAIGAHLAAAAWQTLAIQQVKAGQLAPVKLPTAEQRGGKPPAPQTPPGPWKRYLDAADVYVKYFEADPDLKKAPAERALQTSPAQVALVGAEIEYAFDNFEEARTRFKTIIDRWPSEPGVIEDAVPLYLQTFLVLKDDAGYRDALAELRKRAADAQAQAEKSNDPQRKAAVAKVVEMLGRFEAGAGFEQASAMLAAGKAAEAAAAFEAIAAQYPDGPDAPLALYNASVAWSKANQPEKAVAAARTILEKYPDSKVAATATLSLASVQSRKGDHKGAAQLYGQYLDKYPDAPNRCLALQNVGYEQDVLGNKAEAATRYLAFGTAAPCAKEDPNAAAKALYRAGRLFLDAKQKAKANEAFLAAAQVPGVTDEVAKSQVAEAKRLSKKK